MRRTVTSLVLLICLSLPLHAEGEKTRLRWIFPPDETLAIDKFTVQEILRNGREVRRYAIRDEYLLTAGSPQNGFTPLSGTYRSYERNVGTSADPWLLITEIPLLFSISPTGLYSVPAERVYPTIRNIPAFPEEPVGPGDSWSIPGEEIFPFTPPVTATVQARYTWRSNKKTNNRTLAVLSFTYSFDHTDFAASDRPVRYTGTSDSLMLFDADAGAPVSVSHQYDISLTYRDRTTVTYRGSLTGTYNRRRKITQRNKNALLKRMERALPSRKNEGVSVRPAKEGVIISLDEIFFDTDSARIKPALLSRLHRIGKALKRDPGVAVIVEGHTDDRGSAEHNQRLSEDRAKTVLDWFVNEGYLTPATVSFIGKGKREPVAPNTTPEGRRRNRRVEILLRQE